MAFDDFNSTTLSSMWGGAYNGTSGGDLTGLFVSSHLVLKGDGLLRLEAYPDPTGVENSYGYTPALAASINNWGGAGVQSTQRYAPPVTFQWTSKYDVYPGITPITLLWPSAWPPEMDIMESYNPLNGTTKGQAINTLYATFHWGANNSQQQIKLTGFDFSQWHLWQVVYTTTNVTIYIDGTSVGSITFTPAMLASPNSILTPYGLTFQIQTGDPDNPPADTAVTAANPVTMYVDWAAIDVPTTTSVAHLAHPLPHPSATTPSIVTKTSGGGDDTLAWAAFLTFLFAAIIFEAGERNRRGSRMARQQGQPPEASRN